MGWLLVGAGLLTMVLLYGRSFVNADPKKVAVIVRNLGGALAVALGALLAARGGVMIGGPLVVIGLGALFPNLRLLGFGGARPSAGVSEVETAFVRMRLDRDSGAIEGSVKTGSFAGRPLSALSESEVRSVLTEAEGADPDGAALLRAYIARRFAGAGAGAGARGSRSAAAAPSGAMSQEEALAVLGLERGATEDEVRAAHKRLMVKLHPDQGGSSWLAVKLNAARERLIGKG
jgi:hypothetical protein